MAASLQQERISTNAGQEESALHNFAPSMPNRLIPSSGTIIGRQYQWWEPGRISSWWNGLDQKKRDGGDTGPLSSIVIVVSAMMSFVYGNLLFGDANTSVGSAITSLWIWYVLSCTSVFK